MAEIASAFVTIAPSAKGFGSKLNSQVGSGVKSSGTSLGKTFGKLFAASAGLIAAVGIKDFLSGSIDEAREAQKVGAQTGAVLKSTGKIANVSAGQVTKLASALSAKIGVDDEAIQAGENLLLTFTNVRNEVGKGNDIFNQATRTVQDMAAGFGGDAVSNSKILGKALNDPVKGVSALTRVGVSFTEGQKEQIKTLVDTGHALDAQKIILGELTKETAGSAEAQVTNADKARVAYGNLQETVGTALLPTFDKLANIFTTRVAPSITDFITGMQQGTGAGGQFRNVLENIGSTVKGVATFLNGLPGPVKSLALEAGAAAVILPRLSSAINSVGDAMSTAAIRTGTFRRGLLLAAGVGGMVAITEGAKTGNKQIGLLGQAMTGAFVGGTLGSAIPGVGTAIGAVGGAAIGAGIGMFRLQRAANAAGESAGTASPKIDGLAESLNQTTGAATRATKALILQKLQQDGVVTSAGQLGIATSDLIKSSLGNRKAIDRVNNAWEKNGNLLDGLTNSKVSDWLATLRTDLSKSQSEIKKNNAALDGTDRAAKKAGPSLASVGKDRPSTGKWAALYAGDLNEATTKTGTFSKKTRQLLGAATAETNRLSSAIRRIPNKTVTITVQTIRAPGGKDIPLPGGQGRSGRELPDAYERMGRESSEGLAKGLLHSADKAGQAADKLTKKVKEKITKLRDTLSSVRDDFASLVEPITSAFTGDLFEADTASAFITNLTSTNGTLGALKDAFKTLLGWGLSPGFLSQLFQSGNAGLILDLAKNKDVASQAGSLFGTATSLSQELGTAVAGATDKGAALENQTVRLEKKLDHLIKAVHHSARETGAEINGAASAGHRRGNHGGRRAA